ncbi:MAG: nucleotidyltransferase domain-containing protein [Thiohalocapsa sp.]|nr:nucleotidyltransferase domain-containing protein [Thiohalocapsa sp.]
MPKTTDTASAPASEAAPGAIAAAAVPALAARFGWRLVVLFGSVALGKDGRDIDLAVMPASAPDLLTLGAWQAELEAAAAPKPVDLVMIGPDLSPVTRFEIFRNGRCLFETEPSLFDRERDRAFFLFADSEWFRRQQREALYGDDA